MESWQVEVGGGCRVRSRWHLRRVQVFAPTAREEGDCDLYDEGGKSQHVLLYFLVSFRRSCRAMIAIECRSVLNFLLPQILAS